MPSTLEIPEQVAGETDLPCCPETVTAVAPEPSPVPELEPELQTPHQLDRHDLELLCGVDR